MLIIALLSVLTSSAQLQANFKSDVLSGCSPLVVNFNDQSTGGPSNWVWTLGNGTTSFLQHPTTTYFVPGTYNVKLVIRNATGADSVVKTQFITVYANPVVAFNVSDSTGCFPKTVQFTDKSLPGSGTITQWSWDFGDGALSTQSNPVHTYTNAGSFSVTLKVVNSMGCQKTISKAGVINLQNPVAGFSFAIGASCTGSTTIQFNSSAVNATTHQWNFGDGTSSSTTNPVHQYASAGVYDVTLIVTAPNGCRDSIVKQITVGSIAANFSHGNICESTQVTFLNLSSPSPVGAQWDFGDGSTSAEINPSKQYASAGDYQVRLISDFGGCRDTIIKSVTVHPAPSAAFTEVGDRIKCAPTTTINFNAVQPNLSYQWDFGDGNSAVTKNPSHVYTTYGNHDVTLIVTSPFGCTDTLKKPMHVRIVAPEITDITGIFEGCAPYTATFNSIVSTVDPVVGWTWSLGDGATSTSASPSHYYGSPGIYNISVEITTSEGCKDTFSYPAAIQISNKPVAAFTATPQLTCAAGPIQFNNTSTGALEYFWIFNDGGFSSLQHPVHQFGDTGVFTITLIATSTGCSDTLTIPNYIRNDPPIGRFNVIQNCGNPYEVQFRDSSIGGQTYLWRFGDGDSSILRNPKHTYKSPGIYNVEFTVFHNACSYLSTGTVHIVDEHPQIVLSDTAICRTQGVVLTTANLNASNIDWYHWEFGNGDSRDTALPVAPYNYLQNGRYYPTLVTRDRLGCLDTASNVVTLNVYGPYAGFSNAPGICLNTTAFFTDTSKTDGLHAITGWTWNFGDGITEQSPSGPVSHLYQNAGAYNVGLVIKDNFGCEDAVFHASAITIANPIAAFVSSDSIRCSSNAVTFNNNSAGIGLQSAWSFGDNTVSTDLNPQHNYLTEGEYFVTLTITDQYGCKDSTTRNQVISNPLASFIASDTIGQCPPLLVNLTNTATSYTNTVWDFGDGSGAALNDPSHYYTYPGTYQLKLKSIGYGNCVDSATKTIVIKGPTGSFTVAPTTICANSMVSFTATSNDNDKILWDFSDGNTVVTTSSTVSHVYDMPGYYQPRMILIDTAGCEVPVVSPDTINVLGVQAKIDIDKTLYCDSALVQFRDSSVLHNDIPASYQWNFGDGSSSNMANPIHKYVATGIYTTKLTITTQAGCIDSVTSNESIVVVHSPVVAISSNTSLCKNDTINFSGTVVQADTSALTWHWSFSNGQTSTMQNPSQSFDNDGTFMVTAVATNSSGCTDTATRSILVHPLPDVDAGTDTMICRGNTYTLQPTGAATYQWRSDLTLSCTSCSSAVAEPVHNRVYYVTGTSQFGCQSSDSVQVEVVQPFDLSVNRDDTLCAGSAVQLKAHGAAKYSWFPSSGLSNAAISNPVASPSATVNYMVVGTDNRNCFSDTGYLKLSVFPVPQFNIVDKSINLPAGSSVKIATTSSADITSWKWYPAKDLSCADCPQPVVTAKDNTLYRVEASNDGGCTTRDEVSISVICNDGNVFIPNTFSPNNDGMNDVFYPRGKGINEIKSMKIFNRWGELVYEKTNFSANDQAAGWNGSYKGSVLTPDVYVYIVDVVCYNSAVFTLKGNVSLIR